MSPARRNVKSWSQTSLVPPISLRIECAVHLDELTGHHQLDLQWSDAHSGDLLGVWCAPLRSGESALSDVGEVTETLEQLLLGVLDPF